jgi:hypothetical protein
MHLVEVQMRRMYLLPEGQMTGNRKVQATVSVATDGQDCTTLRRGQLSNHDVGPSVQGMEVGVGVPF